MNISTTLQGTSFHPDFITNRTARKILVPFTIERKPMLTEALANQLLKPDSELVVADLGGGKAMAVSKRHLAYHHIAHAFDQQIPYIICFCVVCNSGGVFDLRVEGKPYEFEIAGVFNGMMMMRDKQTGSYWDHVTGECLWGEHKGYQLHYISSLRFLPAQRSTEIYPLVRLAIPQQKWSQRVLAFLQNAMQGVFGAFLPPGFRRSIKVDKVDDRLPEMEMGLGVWIGQRAKFYSMSKLKSSRNAILDQFAGKSILIYIDTRSSTPNAIFTKAEHCEWIDEELHLDNGKLVKNGQLCDKDGQNCNDAQSPNFMFSRWYGFSLTFPDCAIHGQV